MLNQGEIDVIRRLREELQKNDKGFVLTGKVQDGEESLDFDRIGLYFSSPIDVAADGGSRELRNPPYVLTDLSTSSRFAPLPLSEPDLLKLYNSGTPWMYGDDDKEIPNSLIHQARELKPPHFALTDDLLARSAVLDILPRTLYGNSNRTMIGRLERLNVYGKGGFLVLCQDTRHGKTHIGSLTFCLPSEFTGGEFVVRHDEEEIVIDCAKDVSDVETGSPCISWTFIHSDCEYEVLPVISGTRVTITYDVYLVDVKHDSVEDPFKDKVVKSLRSSIYRNPDFLPKGGRLAFGLAHAYPVERHLVENALSTQRLMGMDHKFAEFLDEHGIPWKFYATYDSERDGLTVKSSGRPKPREEEKPFLFRDIVLTNTCFAFQGLNQRQLELGDYDEHEEKYEYDLVKWVDGWRGDRLVWITQPGHRHVKNDFCSTIGSDIPYLKTVYAGVAIVAELPNFTKRAKLLKQLRD